MENGKKHVRSRLVMEGVFDLTIYPHEIDRLMGKDNEDGRLQMVLIQLLTFMEHYRDYCKCPVIQ